MAGWDSLIFAPDVVQIYPEHPACSNWTDHFGKTCPGKLFGVPTPIQSMGKHWTNYGHGQTLDVVVV